MLTVFIAFAMGLCLGFCVKFLITYHQVDHKAAEEVRLHTAAETEATAYQHKVKRLAGELTAAETKAAHPPHPLVPGALT